MLKTILKKTTSYINKMPKSLRKNYGQFFTSKETAIYMASLFNVPQSDHISVLDPGAGSGILSAAIIERLCKSGIKNIDLVCYENDDNIIGLLEENLALIKLSVDISFNYEIRKENYILTQECNYNYMLGADSDPRKYDIVIGNPPYKKIPKDAPEALAMPDICYGAPNLYFIFMEMAVFDLVPDGEMVFIIPRSWTSGAYFKSFRQKFFSECVIEHIHLFVSRDKVFDNESVLQETMIIKVKKSIDKPEKITVTTTNSNSDFSDITRFNAPYDVVVAGSDKFVYLVTNADDVDTLEKLSQWSDTLPSLGMRMKTGLTVDFRNRDALKNAEEDSAVPLFYSQHIQNGKVVFPIGKENEYIVTNQSGLLQNNSNYLFVKRFTAKEEHRRLQCGIYLARKYPKYTKISTQNKINFIDGLFGLSECVVYGLYVLFNSTIYDRYYRILNGSTQVNSTEVNTMPVPPLNTIEKMGQELIKIRDMSEGSCNKILRSYL